MKLLISLSLCILSLNALAFSKDELWHAHDEINLSADENIRKSLSYIYTESQTSAGLEFISLSYDQRVWAYDGLDSIPDYKKRIGENYFRSYEVFAEKMTDFAHQLPDGSKLFAASGEALARSAYYFKRMKADLSGKQYTTFQESFGSLQLADYRKTTQQYHDMALKICNGDTSNLGFMYKLVPNILIEKLSKFFTGQSCKNAIKRDILNIVNPYNNPVSVPGTESKIEGTGIYLASKLIPNRHYERTSLYRALIKSQNITNLDANVNLFNALKNQLGTDKVDTLRLISLVNHNHGLEYFVLNAILDLSNNEKQAVSNVIKSYSAINHLYQITNTHVAQRKRISNKKEDQLARNYHYWGGAFITCELMIRGYVPIIAEKISSKLGSAYEEGSRDTSKESIQESENDILLHDLGAQYATSICKY